MRIENEKDYCQTKILTTRRDENDRGSSLLLALAKHSMPLNG
jgi:hypothetical protein